MLSSTETEKLDKDMGLGRKGMIKLSFRHVEVEFQGDLKLAKYKRKECNTKAKYQKRYKDRRRKSHSHRSFS